MTWVQTYEVMYSARSFNVDSCRRFPWSIVMKKILSGSILSIEITIDEKVERVDFFYMLLW